MKKTILKISSLIAISLIGLTGCSIKDADTCEMKYSKIILNMNLDADTPEDAELISKIRNINPEFNISNRKTNIIKTNYYEASLFYKEYQELINIEIEKIKNETTEFRRTIKNNTNISKNECPTKTLYINGISTSVIENAEYVITLED